VAFDVLLEELMMPDIVEAIDPKTQQLSRAVELSTSFPPG